MYFKESIQEMVSKTGNQNEGDFVGHEVSFENANEHQRRNKSLCAVGRQSKPTGNPGCDCFSSRKGWIQHKLEKVSHNGALLAGSYTAQDSLVLNKTRRNVYPDAVYTIADLVRNLFREWDVSIGNS